MNRLFIIIQARMTSSRLPGKVLLPLKGKSVLEVLLYRLREFKENIIIATTNDGSEKPIVELCTHLGIDYFRGDTNNVLDRYYNAAINFGAKEGDIIIRITSDCPFADPYIIKDLIGTYKNNPHSYGYVDIHHSYPRGMDGEIFDFSSLKDAYLHASTPFDQEHVTPYIKKLPLQHFALNHHENNSSFRLTIDTPEDYEMFQQLALYLDNDASYETIVHTLNAHPEITTINAHVTQKQA